MSLSIDNVTFDCHDPRALAAFWSAALDRPVAEGATEFFASVPGGAAGVPTLLFLQVPEGKAVKNRVHLDLATHERDAEVARLRSLGATHVADKDEWGMTWTVLTDPEGNEFCVGAPH